jgi:hypothetical protein
MSCLTLALAAAFAISGGGTPRLAANEIWPNDQSRANSDEWLAVHHDEIRLMRPHRLVLNFANRLSRGSAESKAKALTGIIAEASRYHGYADPNAPAFLMYDIVKVVDLTDHGTVSPSTDGNSSLYPRRANSGINFRYADLFSQRFADLYGIKDPSGSGRNLTLKELVARGLVHEVWFFAEQGNQGAPFESVEVKQAYDVKLKKIPGKFLQAGNGGADDQPWIDRSLRIAFINASRGSGCEMESLSHSIEGTSNSGAIPYFSKYFKEFAGFDLKDRYGHPFDSFYDHKYEGKLNFPAPTTLEYVLGGQKHQIDYVATGTSVHFPPNARTDYDLDNPQTVMSTIEHFRMHDGPSGKDRAEPWTIAKYAKYLKFAPDCMGPWLVYWRQNFPGLNNKSKDDTGRPMKNWWPFLFY